MFNIFFIKMYFTLAMVLYHFTPLKFICYNIQKRNPLSVNNLVALHIL